MTREIVVCLALVLAAPTASAAWTEPAGWADIGTVQQWAQADAHFYRIEGLTFSLAARFHGSDQKKIYRETLRTDSHLPRLDLEAFVALPAAEQKIRRDAAAAALERVGGFRNRLADLVMRVRTQQDVAWGMRDQDPRVVDDLLGHLQTAVDLDPSDPYPWHLLAYFAGVVGDQLRALDALDALDEALALVPAGAMTGMRHRALLDRAWLLRDRGYFAQAAEALDRAAGLAEPGLEERILRGLLAAQTGDMDQAFRIAAELDGVRVPVFARDWETTTFAAGILDPQAWPKKPSGYLKGWILGLAWLQEGDTEMARKALGEFDRQRHYFLGHRFWNEAGIIYEATGRLPLAEKAWSMAQMFTPYYPYQLSIPYSLALAPVTGRPGRLPFMLAYDSFCTVGSRLAFGSSLVTKALEAPDRAEQIELAGRAAEELRICLRFGTNTAPAAVMYGHAQAVLGNPLEMLRAADLADEALARPGQDQTCRPALVDLRRAAAGSIQNPGLKTPGKRRSPAPGRDPQEDPAVAEVRLRRAYRADPADDPARRALARFLLRQGDQAEGAELALIPLDRQGIPPVEDLVLILEVDRLRDDPTRARDLLELLLDGQGDRWPDARLWAQVGFLCQDHGIAGARRALEYALELEPDNQGLAKHLKMTAPGD